MKLLKKFTVKPILQKEIKDLETITKNLYWTWDDRTFNLLDSINHKLFKSVKYDPEKLFGELNVKDLKKLSQNQKFVNELNLVKKRLNKYLKKKMWFQKELPENFSTAYFSPEFGITEILPQYSGGLGILAGDHLKAASDLGVNLIGVGLLYKGGYFSQSLSNDGWQLESYPVIDPDSLPIKLLRDKNGKILYVKIPMPNNKILKAHIWCVSIGRISLLLLDSDVSTNNPFYKKVTDTLYGGDNEHRILQEILLGVGGIKALKLYSKEFNVPIPNVYHMNEGHAGFMCLERLAQLVISGKSNDEAFQLVKSSTIFTTHTPVPAGIDKFPVDIAKKYIAPLIKDTDVSIKEILILGNENYRIDKKQIVKRKKQDSFNMAVLGLKTSNNANGVSKLHGEVSRKMFHKLWGEYDIDDIPITSVTNGVHYKTWTNPFIRKLLKTKSDEKILINNLDMKKIWKTKQYLKLRFVEKIRARLKASWLERGLHETELSWIDNVFDPNILTIGFARRASAYKQLTLILNDPERLKKLLLNKDHPIQIIFAGKSHPNDEE